MKKIISLFQRNYEGDRLVRNEIVPNAEWVLSGDGIATRKWDGTACMASNGNLYKRYDAKNGKIPPAGFIPAQDPDPETGHWPGWLLVMNDKSDKWYIEARNNCATWPLPNWTYELIGPKIQGNAEGLTFSMLMPHGKQYLPDCPRDYGGIGEYLKTHDIEGIVWWRDINNIDYDKVKIKTKDFGLRRGVSNVF